MMANQASQKISNLGKDNVSNKPLDAAKNKLSLLSLFIFNTKFPNSIVVVDVVENNGCVTLQSIHWFV